MAQQQDASPSLEDVAELGAAAIQAGIALWWRLPGLLAGVPAHASADMDGREREKAATAKIVAAQIEAMRTLAAALNTTAPAGAPVQAEPAGRTAE